ncbi:hypothetical protein [Paludisphaera borealis]|uniref:Carboxypeptidase regulatory-like domain-containing protein n=1 Tax=Paludisphaera borealis TaxID=1387353 RepID=A0A1U7CRN9_9BACT|nr:hypothetical protein [Paludisphaera borealis]APW61568.1 hypothetical protein BSF38_03086 [Paludisphaera borealis]
MNFRPSQSLRAPRLALASALLLLALPSCGNDDGRPKRHPATGKVLVDGKGTGGIQIRLVPVDRLRDVDALRPSGVTDDGGAYRLGTYDEDDGAPVGRYKVILFWPDAPPGQSRPKDLFGGRYAKPESSVFELTIADGENQLADIETAKAAAPAKPRPTTRRNAALGPDPDGPSAK